MSTIAALSLAADDDSPAMVLCVYRLQPGGDQDPRPTAEELAALVRDLSVPESRQATGVYVRAINNRLLVRERPDVHREILSLLRELDALLYDCPGCCTSVVPVVGERPQPQGDRTHH